MQEITLTYGMRDDVGWHSIRHLSDAESLKRVRMGVFKAAEFLLALDSLHSIQMHGCNHPEQASSFFMTPWPIQIGAWQGQFKSELAKHISASAQLSCDSQFVNLC